MLDHNAAMERNDAREYYALTRLPGDWLRIFVENLENYIVNNLEKIPELTIKDIIGTEKIETLSLRAIAYILVLRYVERIFVVFNILISAWLN